MTCSKLQLFDEKRPSEIVSLGFDFRRLTSSLSNPVVTVTWKSGVVDASPSALIGGAPVIQGSKVFQRILDGIDGADYYVNCQVDAPDGSRYVLSGILPVRIPV